MIVGWTWHCNGSCQLLEEHCSLLQGSQAYSIKDIHIRHSHQSHMHIMYTWNTNSKRVSCWHSAVRPSHGLRTITSFALQTNWKTFETDATWTLDKFFSHQSSLPAFTMGAQPMVLWWEAPSAHRACASCRENTFLLTAWLKLDHQMASLYLSRHLIKIRCLWSILSRITALMWSGINIWFPLLSCVHLNIFFSLHKDLWGRNRNVQLMQVRHWKALHEWKYTVGQNRCAWNQSDNFTTQGIEMRHYLVNMYIYTTYHRGNLKKCKEWCMFTSWPEWWLTENKSLLHFKHIVNFGLLQLFYFPCNL